MSDPNVIKQPKSPPVVACSDLLGAYYRGSDGAATCALCNCEMEWECCSDCGGEGWHDAYEDDPIYYQPGDTKPCHTCNGEGGMHWCVTKDCETNCGWNLIPAPEAPNAPGEPSGVK